MKELIIRIATSSDLEALRNISIKTFKDAFSVQNTKENMEMYITNSLSKEKLSKELENPASEFYFALLNQEIIGYLKINIGDAQTEPLENALEIERIYVLQAFHGQKIAPELLQKALTRAAELNSSFIWLGVWEHNPRAIAFYTKNGFVEFGRHPFMLGQDLQTDILMKRVR